MGQHQNLEFKAKSSQEKNQAIRLLLISMNAQFKGLDHQLDTYFNVSKGRLKLRQGNIENNLIYYERSNEAGQKISDVSLVKVEDAKALRDLLAKSHGVLAVVDKKRDIYFVDHVKIHLDEVSGLGSFLEVEVINSSGQFSEEELKKTCDHFQKIFKVEKPDFVSHSYSDMIKATNTLEELEKRCRFFCDEMKNWMLELKLPFDPEKVDHVCYRVETEASYQQWKEKLSLLATLLTESAVGGRLISTFELPEPWYFGDVCISVIELPAPKKSSFYTEGFEHWEIVTTSNLHDIKSQFPLLKFEGPDENDAINPCLTLRHSHKPLCVRYHQKSLKQVIEIEKSSSCAL